jgi:predicted transglutaminase-like cysteine proteinase
LSVHRGNHSPHFHVVAILSEVAMALMRASDLPGVRRLVHGCAAAATIVSLTLPLTMASAAAEPVHEPSRQVQNREHPGQRGQTASSKPEARTWATAQVAAAVGTAAISPNAPAGPYMRIYGQANPPYGFVQFCSSFPAECVQGDAGEGRFNADPARLAELDAINRQVNASVEPVTDMDLYGVPEWWAIPANGRGDCEDYALLKRQLLISRGWPVSSVLVTVVRDEKGEGHAVLTARTAQGDFVLDNKAPDLKLWNNTPYKFVMRQSYLNVKVWMSLDPKETVAPGPMAGVKIIR